MGLGGFPNVYRRFILGPSHGSVGRLRFRGPSSLVVRRWRHLEVEIAYDSGTDLKGRLFAYDEVRTTEDAFLLNFFM